MPLVEADHVIFYAPIFNESIKAADPLKRTGKVLIWIDVIENDVGSNDIIPEYAIARHKGLDSVVVIVAYIVIIHNGIAFKHDVRSEDAHPIPGEVFNDIVVGFNKISGCGDTHIYISYIIHFDKHGI